MNLEQQASKSKLAPILGLLLVCGSVAQTVLAELPIQPLLRPAPSPPPTTQLHTPTLADQYWLQTPFDFENWFDPATLPPRSSSHAALWCKSSEYPCDWSKSYATSYLLKTPYSFNAQDPLCWLSDSPGSMIWQNTEYTYKADNVRDLSNKTLELFTIQLSKPPSKDPDDALYLKLIGRDVYSRRWLGIYGKW